MGLKSPKSPDVCHIDSYLDSRQRLSCVAYIDDVAPHGGAFMVRHATIAPSLIPRLPTFRLKFNHIVAWFRSGRARTANVTRFSQRRNRVSVTVTLRQQTRRKTSQVALTVAQRGQLVCKKHGRGVKTISFQSTAGGRPEL